MREYFKDSELECKCGCGRMNIVPEFRHRLNVAREVAGVSFVISSGCRCPEHNKKEGGVATSSHIDGLAVDIVAISGHHRFKIITGLIIAGFTRIGINAKKGFVHVDMDDSKPQQTIFLYP